MKIEFFHDVICSFCFPMSYRMRQIQKKYPEIEIVHKSFALVRQDSDFDLMFESREAAKEEVLSHWEVANQNDDLHRFNIEGMRETEFFFPTSIPSLRAAKAAEIVGGNDLAWDAYDALQHAFFVLNKNVGEDEVIVEAMKTIDIDMEAWEKEYRSDSSLQGVEEDIEKARAYGISGVPFIVVNEKYGLNGAQPMEHIEAMLNQIQEEENKKPLQMMTETPKEGGACEVDEDGKWNCD